MGKSFRSHTPKPALLGKAGLGASLSAAPQAKETKPLGTKPRAPQPTPSVKEIGGPSGPEPTRYGDWERKGICYDF